MHHSDVVIQGVASNLFWLIVFLTAVIIFRTEIKNLLNSLGSFKVAGASFELKDSRETIKTYVVLTNMMLELLLNRDNALTIGDLLSSASIAQLSNFAVTYAKDVPEDAVQIELLKNVSAILAKRGDVASATLFYEAILKIRPNDPDILGLKASTLGNRGAISDILEAEKILDILTEDVPYKASNHWNRALGKARLGKLEEAIASLNIAIELGHWKKRPKMMDVREFSVLRGREDFEKLRERVERLRNQAEN